MSTAPISIRAELERLQWWSLAVGGVALLLCVVGAIFSPDQFFRSYLTAYLFWLGIPLGCLATLMIYHLTGGVWGFLIRRVLEASIRTLPLFALMFVPLVFGLGRLFLWARPEVVAADHDLQHKQIYLNVPFFLVRAAFFFLCWIVIGSFLSSWSRQQDEIDSLHLPRKFRLLSAPGLIVYGVTITFAAVDWVMSLQPAFRSTIFGPLFATGQLLSGQAFALIVLAWLVNLPPLAGLVARSTLNDLGNLLFTFLILWAYMAFFQFMLIWMANLPDEIIWYLPRSQGGWQWVAWALFLFHFAVPFFLLLMRDIKRNPRTLAATAGLLLFMQLVFMNYQVLPAFPDTSITQHWMNFFAPVGIGGIWLAYFLWQLTRSPLVPSPDLNREEAIRLCLHDREEATRLEALYHG